MKPVWVCPKCGAASPVNTDHNLWEIGHWKIGAREKLRCRECAATTLHEVK